MTEQNAEPGLSDQQDDRAGQQDQAGEDTQAWSLEDSPESDEPGQSAGSGSIPEPQIDPEPDPGNEAGGVDAVPGNGTTPPVPPDEPLNAQMEEEEVPDEIQRLEDPDRAADTEDPSSESPG
jgi:hypothetical protein